MSLVMDFISNMFICCWRAGYSEVMVAMASCGAFGEGMWLFDIFGSLVRYVVLVFVGCVEPVVLDDCL